MKVDLPVQSLEVSVFTVPTDAPEADGTASWDSTTLVVAEPVAGDMRGIGWSYTGGAAGAAFSASALQALIVAASAR